MVTSKQQTACPVFEPFLFFFCLLSQKDFSVSFDNGPHTPLFMQGIIELAALGTSVRVYYDKDGLTQTPSKQWGSSKVVEGMLKPAAFNFALSEL